MIEVASRVIIVADHTKFGRGGMIPVAPLTAAHLVVSDAELSPEYVALLCEHGVEVLLA
jgi:DeoR/GlpR family transcriptional regulator of sugar metabolism